MPSSLPTTAERAKPLLGTTVSIRASLPGTLPAVQAAIDGAFGVIGRVHRLMSYHASGSDLSRINRTAAIAPVQVAQETYAVIEAALRIAEQSNGAFDPAAGGRLAAAGHLPAPAEAPEADPDATWRDIELVPSACAVRLRRPAWLDLGGIAKGYAVDAACSHLAAQGAVAMCVNAGGDLRVHGAGPEPVLLRWSDGPDAGAAIELEDGALASSGWAGGVDAGLAARGHLDPRTGQLVVPGRFIAVVAPTCQIADALTKVVLASEDPLTAEPCLAAFGATAHVREPAGDWTTWGCRS